jgi:excisionase family DNA binding protein
MSGKPTRIGRRPPAARSVGGTRSVAEARKRKRALLRATKKAQRGAARETGGGGFSMAFPRGARGDVAKLAVQVVLESVGRMPERAAEQILADVRGASAPASRVMEWLRDGGRTRSDREQAIEQAFGRGDERRAAILRDPALLTGEAAAERLGVSRETINKRAQQGKLLALQFGKRGKRYPQWQFEDGVAGAPLESVLVVLRSADAWQRYRFFTQLQPALGGRTPVEALRQGMADRVIRAAEGWFAGDQGGG